MYLTVSITNGTGGINIYFARDVLGDINLIGLFSICMVLPMILMAPFIAKLFARFGKKKVVMVMLGFSAVVKFMMFLFPRIIAVQLGGAFFGTLEINSQTATNK